MLKRALQLSEKIGDYADRLKTLEFLTIHYGLDPSYLSRARVLTMELLTIAEDAQDSELIGWARYWLGWLSMFEGDFPAALQELDQAHKLSLVPSAAQPERPMNWRVHSRAFASFVLWVSGYPTRAVGRAREASIVARELRAGAADHLFVCWWSANLHLLLRESTTAARFSDEAMMLVA